MRTFTLAAMLVAIASTLSVSAQEQVEKKNPTRTMVSATLNQPSIKGITTDGNLGFRASVGKEYFVSAKAPLLDLYAASTLAYSYEKFEAKSGYNATTTRHKLILPVGLGLRVNITKGIGAFLEAGPYASFVVGGKSNFEMNRWGFGGHSNLGVNIGQITAMIGAEVSSNSAFKVANVDKATDITTTLSIGMRF